MCKYTCEQTHIDAVTHGNISRHINMHTWTHACIWHKTAMVILGQILETDSAGQAALGVSWHQHNKVWPRLHGLTLRGTFMTSSIELFRLISAAS